jgi:hypothetical protein
MQLNSTAVDQATANSAVIMPPAWVNQPPGCTAELLALSSITGNPALRDEPFTPLALILLCFFNAYQ